MRRLVLTTLLLAGPASVLAAQESSPPSFFLRPAPSRAAIEEVRPVEVRGPTIVALSPYSAADSIAVYQDGRPMTGSPGRPYYENRRLISPMEVAERFAAAKALADSLGFTLVVRLASQVQLIDRQGAHYTAPPGVEAGYIIMMPGLRPRVVPGLVGPRELRAEVRAYKALVQGLAPS